MLPTIFKGPSFKQEEADYYLFERFILSALIRLCPFALAATFFRNCLSLGDISAFNVARFHCMSYFKVLEIRFYVNSLFSDEDVTKPWGGLRVTRRVI